MRIITGSLKGRRLKSPKNNDVRPTSDKVKEAMFDMLYPYLKNDFVCMDVFAGSGNLGIEAISRGASKVYFSDSSRESLANVRENLNYCNVADKAVLLAGDFKSNIRRVHEKIDIFFVDPPYADRLVLEVLDGINTAGNASDDCIVVCEHSQKDELPSEYNGFTAIKNRTYGAVSVTIYTKCKGEA